MKLATIILMISLMQVSAASFGQKVTFHQRNTTLEKVIREIRKQTGYDVLFPTTRISISSRVNADFQNASLKEVMNNVLEGKGLTYTIEANMIVVMPQDKAPESAAGSIELIDIRGRVLNETGNPLVGATVKVKGTSRTVQTNFDGYYVLRNVATTDVLSISYLGYKVAEIAVSKEMADVRMEIIAGKLEEVAILVNTGYQRLPKERSAGSFSMIGKDVLEKRNNYNITDYLQGQVSGLLSSATGDLTIRGQSTFSASKQPLIVVDGFPIERDIESINPNDIENITVLKDASAASIWGVRAANGVIVIQTKRNTVAKKPLDISFSSSVSISGKPDLSKLPFANSISFLDYEKFKVDNKLTFFTGKPRPALTTGLDAYLNNPTNAAGIVEPLKNINSYDEFSDLFLRPAVRQQYALSIAGKGEKTYQRASFNYDDAQTSSKNTGRNRLMIDLYQRSDLSSKITLDLGVNFTAVNAKNNGMSISELTNLAPYQKILDANGNYVPQPKTFYQADKDALVAAGYPYNWNYNLMQEFNNKDNTINSKYLTAMAGLNYLITKNLSFNSGYQFEYVNDNNTQLQNEETYNVRNLINFSTTNPGGVVKTGIPKGSIINQTEGRRETHTFRNQFRYNGDLGNMDHELTAIAGLEVRQVGYKSTTIQKYGYDPQTLQYTNVNYTSPYTTITGGSNYIPDASLFVDNKDRYVSVYSNAGYTYLGKYSVNASARLDKTNLFGSSDKYKNVWLWSSGISWQAHKESFLRDGPFSSLILRASYGINGNVDRSTSPFLTANVAIDPKTNQPYGYVLNPVNPLLRWEKTTVTNLGLDFTILKGRLSGTIEYYNRKSTDLLGNSTVNGTYGFSNAYINYASMRNSGLDVHLSAQILKGPFTINAMLNYSYNKNKVLDVDFPQKTAGAYIGGAPQEGLPLNYLYSYRWAGLSPTGAPRVMNEKGEATDYTKEMTNPLALVYNGTAVSPHYGGLFTAFGYKQFTLTAGLVYKAGHKFRVPVIQYNQLFETSFALSKDWDNRWKQAGDENKTNIPAMPKTQTGLNVYDSYSKYADINIADASTIRFQELLLNYTLPGRGAVGQHLPVINLGLQVRNLGVYTFNKGNLDPEYLTIDKNNIQLTPPTEYTFTLRVNF